jgi:serine/threonine protein phosphatase PrpC
MTTAETRCPTCGEPIGAADNFCEACGTQFSEAGGSSERAATGSAAGAPFTSIPTEPTRVARPCVGCGAPAESIGADGYCGQCGLRQPDPRDHEEVDLGIAAGVCDRGLHHHRNEDAMWVETLGSDSVVAVVCDGVSSSVNPQIASRAAADTAGAALLQAVTTRPDQLPAAIVDAVAAAQKAVVAVPWTPNGAMAAPSCTFVSAVVHEGAVTIGWVGDSRAYWLAPADTRRLTADDSWAYEQVASGEMTEQQAEADVRAHAITRWLGEDAPEGDPQVMSFSPGCRGRLVVCSDGLWNYLSDDEQLAALVGTEPSSALAAAQTFTDYALTMGGHDNITVVVIEVEPAPSKGQT